MRKFKVKALSFHSDKVQHIYSAGDEITEDVMHADQVEKHIEDGFIEEIAEVPAKENEPEADSADTEEEAAAEEASETSNDDGAAATETTAKKTTAKKK